MQLVNFSRKLKRECFRKLCKLRVPCLQSQTVYLVPNWISCISGSVHRHRAFVLKHLDPCQDRLWPHGRVILLLFSGRDRLWSIHRGWRGGLCFGGWCWAGFRVHRNGVILLRFVALLLRCWSLVIGRPLGSGLWWAGSWWECAQVRILVVMQIRHWSRRWRIIITDGPWTRRFSIARPSVESLLRWGLVVAERRCVLGIRAVTVWQTGIVALWVGSRVRLTVRVPLLLVEVRHTVLVGQVRVIVAVLWFWVTTSAAADIIPTGWVVVISVWLVRVISLLRAVSHRLHAVTNSPRVVCAVWILLKHLMNKYKTKIKVSSCARSKNILHKHKICDIQN